MSDNRQQRSNQRGDRNKKGSLKKSRNRHQKNRLENIYSTWRNKMARVKKIGKGRGRDRIFKENKIS